MDNAKKLGVRLAIVLFVLVALAHLLRMVFLLEITVAGWVVPQWVSIVGVLVPGFIAYLLWKDR